jgi:hypothetical protein
MNGSLTSAHKYRNNWIPCYIRDRCYQTTYLCVAIRNGFRALDELRNESEGTDATSETEPKRSSERDANICKQPTYHHCTSNDAPSQDKSNS